MSWTDFASINQMIKLRDLYNIKTFVETGTFRGVNAEVHAVHFKDVITCELVEDYYKIAKERLSKYSNVKLILNNSFNFLNDIKKEFQNEMIFIYLDAHFYDPKLPPEDRWVVLKELKALRDYTNCIIAIHDFDNGELGHLIYDGQPLNFDLLKQDLYNVNANFNYYTNTKENCNIINEETMGIYYPHVEMDENTKDTLKYVWSSEQKTYRGILYCIPDELNLEKFNLRKL